MMTRRALAPWIAGLALLAAVQVCPLAAQAALPVMAAQSRPTLAPMLKQVLPAVVNISTRTGLHVERSPLLLDPFFRRFFNLPDAPRERVEQSLGSGVIIDAQKGLVLTNHHVVENAGRITVTLHDDRQFEAELVGSDPEVDLALLRIEAKGLTALPFGDSDALQVGDFVVAIGNPFGLGQTVTSGIVSALGRSGLGLEGYEDFIQTDAPINPGNSGGALVDLEGRLIGINTAIIGSEGGNVGIGFAIPSNMARVIVDQLLLYGEVRRGRLGARLQNVTPKLAEALRLERHGGALIAQVAPASLAEKAGLRPGDVVLAVDDRPVRSAAQLNTLIGLMRIGQTANLDVVRNGERLRLKLTIAETRQAKADAGRLSERLRGALLGEIGPGHPLAGRLQGLEVLEVEPGSAAWLSGLRKGDVIVSVNRQPVANLADLGKALGGERNGLLLHLRRGEGALFIVIR